MRVLPKEYSLVSLTLDDVKKIVDFQIAQGFTDGWKEKMLIGSFNTQSFFCLGVEKGEELKAFVSVTVSDKTADIEDILVCIEERKKGLGSLLLEQALTVLRNLKIERVLLEVRESNLPAIKLYSDFGFKQISVRKKYYNGIENALVLEKVLI